MVINGHINVNVRTFEKDNFEKKRKKRNIFCVCAHVDN